jgi:hypothetical protein
LTVFFAEPGSVALVVIYVSFPISTILAPLAVKGTDGRTGMVRFTLYLSPFSRPPSCNCSI